VGVAIGRPRSNVDLATTDICTAAHFAQTPSLPREANGISAATIIAAEAT
jgi:hypothetical protein